jgi:hypothetical protein
MRTSSGIRSAQTSQIRGMFPPRRASGGATSTQDERDERLLRLHDRPPNFDYCQFDRTSQSVLRNSQILPRASFSRSRAGEVNKQARQVDVLFVFWQ